MPFLVKEYGGHFFLELTGGGDYSIACDQCDTPEKLLGWILHLTEKNWVTREHIHELIDAAVVRGMKLELP